VVLLVLVVGLVYANTLGNEFQYDDRHSIVANPHIRALDSRSLAAPYIITPRYPLMNVDTGGTNRPPRPAYVLP
jgi:hypothetical protein